MRRAQYVIPTLVRTGYASGWLGRITDWDSRAGCQVQVDPDVVLLPADSPAPRLVLLLALVQRVCS